MLSPSSPISPGSPGVQTERRRSWVAPSRGKFVDGFSFSTVGEDIGKLLSSIDDKVVMVGLRKLGKKLWRDDGKFSLLILMCGCKAGVLVRNDVGSFELMEVRKTETDDQIVAVNMKSKIAEVGKVESVSVVKSMDEDKSSWLVSVSTCRNRGEAIMEHMKTSQVSLDYIPSMFKISKENVVPNIMKTFLRGERGNKMEQDGCLLEKIMRHPSTVLPGSSKKKIIFCLGTNDKAVEEQLSCLEKYIADETERNEEQRKIFLQVIKRIARHGRPDSKCLELMQIDPLTGEKRGRAKYRIGAYIKNANMFLEFTRKKERSKCIGWYPMRYGTNSEKENVLVPVKNEDKKVVTDLLFMTPVENICPRIICIMKDNNGKRLVNGCFYDMKVIRERMGKKETIPRIPLIQPGVLGRWDDEEDEMMVPQVERRTPQKKTRDVDKDNNLNVNVKTPLLPVMTMVQSDENKAVRETYRRSQNEEEEKENDNNNNDRPKQSDDETALSEVKNENTNTQESQKIHQEVTEEMEKTGRAVHIPETSTPLKSVEVNGECSLLVPFSFSSSSVLGGGVAGVGREVEDAMNVSERPSILPLSPQGPGDVEGVGGVPIYTQLTYRTLPQCTEERCMVTIREFCDNKVNIIVRVDKKLVLGKETTIDVILKDDNEVTEIVQNDNNNDNSIVEKITNVEKSHNVDKNNKVDLSDNIFIKYRKKNKNINEKKDNENETQRINSIDIYGKGYVMRSKWYSITEEKTYTTPPSCTIRHISPTDKKKFRGILRGCGTRSALIAWTNLPRCMEGREKWAWGISESVSPSDKKDNAITQFYKGAFAKSFSMLTQSNDEEIRMKEEDILRLFPRKEGNWKLSLIETQEELETIIKTGDVKNVLTGGQLPNGKATGFSGLSYEVVRTVCKGEEGYSSLCKIFNHMLKCPGIIPKQYNIARLVGIPKPDGGTRPLCVQETLIKILNKILAIMITRIVRDKLVGTQKCLARTEGQAQAREQVLKYMKEGHKCAIQFDFQNAFGTIDRNKIIERLIYYDINRTVINYIINLLNSQEMIYEIDGETRTIELQTGVPQGEPLSMVLFSLGIDALLEKFESRDGVKVTAYADDVVVTVEKEEMIKTVMDDFDSEATGYGLHLNKMKTKINLKKDIAVEEIEEYGLDGMEIVNINESSSTYVGLPLTLNRKYEIDFVKSKVEEVAEITQKLWDTRTPVQMKYHLQRMCVDSILDYALKTIKYGNSSEQEWIDEIQTRIEMNWLKSLGISNMKILRLPVKYYGLGLLYIKDRWKIMNKMMEVSGEGKREQVTLKYYKEKVKKWKEKKQIDDLDIEKVPPTTNISLSMPPESVARLSDKAFRMMVTLRYNQECDNLQSINNDYSKCKKHNDKDLNLQHLISCPYNGGTRTYEQHNRICKIIRGVLRRKKGVEDVDKEKYTKNQKERRDDGKKNHKADIVYKMNGVDHSVDVVITSSNSTGRGNNVTRAWGEKRREYGEEQNLHIVLMDTAGNIANESWDYLLKIGATRKELRIMQKILFECTCGKVEDVIEKRKYGKL